MKNKVLNRKRVDIVSIKMVKESSFFIEIEKLILLVML